MSNDATLVPTRATGKKSSAKKVAKATPPAPTQPPLNEGDQLAMKAAEILQGLVLSILYDDADQPRGVNNRRLEEVDHLLGRLITPDGHDWCPGDPEAGNILRHLECISSMLDAAVDDLCAFH